MSSRPPGHRVSSLWRYKNSPSASRTAGKILTPCYPHEAHSKGEVHLNKERCNPEARLRHHMSNKDKGVGPWRVQQRLQVAVCATE